MTGMENKEREESSRLVMVVVVEGRDGFGPVRSGAFWVRGGRRCGD